MVIIIVEECMDIVMIIPYMNAGHHLIAENTQY